MFAFNNWSVFISDKDGCRRVGVDLLSKLSAANAKPEPAPAFHSPAQARLTPMHVSRSFDFEFALFLFSFLHSFCEFPIYDADDDWND